MKLVNIPSYLDKELINYIDENTKRASASDFDETSFLNWLYENDIKSKGNPSAYVKSCFVKELEAGTFRPQPKVEYMPNTQVLLNEMRDREIVLLADDVVFVNVLFNYLLNKGVDGGTCRELNRKILSYMKTHDFREYKELIKQSNTLKQYNIDWKHIDKEVKKDIKEWNDLLNELESEE